MLGRPGAPADCRRKSENMPPTGRGGSFAHLARARGPSTHLRLPSPASRPLRAPEESDADARRAFVATNVKQTKSIRFSPLPRANGRTGARLSGERTRERATRSEKRKTKKEQQQQEAQRASVLCCTPARELTARGTAPPPPDGQRAARPSERARERLWPSYPPEAIDGGRRQNYIKCPFHQKAIS